MIHTDPVHNPEWTPFRMAKPRMGTTPNGHNPEWAQPRMGTTPNGHNPEWAQPRMGSTPNGHHLEWAPSRMAPSQMDTIPSGHNPEWTRSRMNTCNYIVTLVFYSYCLVRSLLRRRFKEKLIL